MRAPSFALFALALTACAVDAPPAVDRSGTPIPDELVGLDCEDPGWGWDAPLTDAEVGLAMDYDLGCDGDPWGSPGGGLGGDPRGGGDPGFWCSDIEKSGSGHGIGSSAGEASDDAFSKAKKAVGACDSSYYSYTSLGYCDFDWAGDVTTSPDGTCTETTHDGYPVSTWSCDATATKTCHYRAR